MPFDDRMAVINGWLAAVTPEKVMKLISALKKAAIQCRLVVKGVLVVAHHSWNRKADQSLTSHTKTAASPTDKGLEISQTLVLTEFTFKPETPI